MFSRIPGVNDASTSCYNRITVKARQPAALFPSCCLSYNKRSKWPDVDYLGLITSVFETVSHPLITAFVLSRLNKRLHPQLIHGFDNNTIRRRKNDKADAAKIANYGLSNWLELPRH